MTSTDPCSAPGCDRPALDDSAWCLPHLQAEQQRRAADENLTAAAMTKPIGSNIYEATPRPLEEAERLSAAARQAVAAARLRKAQVPDPAREAS